MSRKVTELACCSEGWLYLKGIGCSEQLVIKWARPRNKTSKRDQRYRMNDNSKWVQAIGEAISQIGSSTFYESLCSAFTRTARISHPMLLYFPDDAGPQVLQNFGSSVCPR